MKIVFLFTLLIIGFCSNAADEKLTVQGTGFSRENAIKTALKNAVDQKYGVQMSNTEFSQMFMGESSVTTEEKSSSLTVMADSSKINIATVSKGRIKSYRVIALEKDPGSNSFVASLEVVFPGKYKVGNDPDNRRRMAVSQFRFNTKNFSVFGVENNAEAWVKVLNNAINTRLTQSRKFTMLDRNFDKEMNLELARLADPNASQDDMIRLGQKLATDYLVVGTVNFINIPAPQQNPFTGKLIFPQQAIFAVVDYRVLLAATGQLKWSDSLKIDAMYFYDSLYNHSLNESAEFVAQQLCDGLVTSILPYEVVGITKDNHVVIGEGGKSFFRGEIFSVFNLGEDVTDTRTGEVIDSTEVRVGALEIVRVTEKLSYAKVIEGKIADFKVGARLRQDEISQKLNFEKNKPEQAPVNNAAPVVQKNTTGGIVVPF